MKNFNLDNELKKFEDKFKDMTINIDLYKTEKSKSIVIYILENYLNYSSVLIKNGTFIQTIYPYIEYAHKNQDTTIEETLTLFAQDFQTFSS